MPTFKYHAVSAAGQVLIGTMEAGSTAEVMASLDRSGCTPISAKVVEGPSGRSWRERLTPEPRSQEITAFTQDLAMLLKGGVVLGDALAILAQMETKRWLVALIRTLHIELSGGKSFSAVLAMHPRVFPPVYVQTVAVAETAGRLEAALTDLAQERLRNERLRAKFVSAVAYPSFLVVAALGVLAFVLLFVIPQFEGALEGFRNKLAPSTLFVFDLSQWLRANLSTVVAGVAVALCLGLLANRLGGKGSGTARLLARLPLTRTVLRYELTVTFCRTLSILLANGVSITTALRLIGDIVRLPADREAIGLAAADVRQGDRISVAFAKRAFLPPHVVQMLRVGEEGGQIADSAARVATFYEAKLETTLGRLTAVLGPALMIAVACLIAWLIVSVMTALISINDLLT